MFVAVHVIMSFQFVYEEKILNSYDIEPLQAVECEGFYGIIIVFIFLGTLSYINAGPCLLSNSSILPWTL